MKVWIDYEDWLFYELFMGKISDAEYEEKLHKHLANKLKEQLEKGEVTFLDIILFEGKDGK